MEPTTPPTTPQLIYVPTQNTNGLATASLVCGILGLPTLICCYAGVILALVAITLGHIGFVESRKLGGLGRNYSIAGMALGYATLALLPFVIALGLFSEQVDKLKG